MKKHIKTLLSLGMSLLLVTSTFTTAYADDVIIKPTKPDFSVKSKLTSTDITSAINTQIPTIDISQSHALVMNKDHNLYTWGVSFKKEFDVEVDPNYVPASNYVSVAIGDYFTMALKSDGSLWTWGYNYDGELGDQSYPGRGMPEKLMDDVVFIDAADNLSYAITSDGTLWSWGNNKYLPSKVMDNCMYVSASKNQTVAIKTDGTLWAWSKNNYTALGDGTNKSSKTPIKIMDNVVSASAGEGTTLAVKSDGTLWVWGYTHLKEKDDLSLKPIKVMDNVATATSGAANYALKNDGTLWAWGFNGTGGVGDGTKTNRYKPVKIMDSVYDVSSTVLNILVLKKDGSLWSWGSNYSGLVGDGTSDTRYKPVKLYSAGNFTTTENNLEYATAKTSTVLLDGEKENFNTFKINGKTYFEINDVAEALSGTFSEFDISSAGEPDAIEISLGYSYFNSDERVKSTSDRLTFVYPLTVYIDGKQKIMNVYVIDGKNYFEINDLASAIGFKTSIDSKTKNIVINSR